MTTDPGTPAGALLAAALHRAGETRASLAAYLGVSPGTVSHWIAGRRRMTTESLTAVAAYLGVPVASLLPASGDTPVEPPSAAQITTALRGACRVSPALAWDVAGILVQVLSADQETRRAWAEAGRQAEAKADAVRRLDDALKLVESLGDGDLRPALRRQLAVTLGDAR